MNGISEGNTANVFVLTLIICGVIKQNESEFANIDLEIEPNKGNKSFFFYCFDNLSKGKNFGMTCPILMGFSAKCSSLNGEQHQVDN